MEMVRLPDEGGSLTPAAPTRDPSAVFPAAAKKAKQAANADAFRSLFPEGKAFVSSRGGGECEGGGGREDSGQDIFNSHLPARPLAEVIKEQKEAKEAERAARWQAIKTGQNRGLDEEEAEFVSGLELERSALDIEAAREEAEALNRFRLEREAAAPRATSSEAADQTGGDSGGGDGGAARAAERVNSATPAPAAAPGAPAVHARGSAAGGPAALEPFGRKRAFAAPSKLKSRKAAAVKRGGARDAGSDEAAAAEGAGGGRSGDGTGDGCGAARAVAPPAAPPAALVAPAAPLSDLFGAYGSDEDSC